MTEFRSSSPAKSPSQQLRLLGVCALVLASFIGSARTVRAEAITAPAAENGRYSMTPAPNGFLRLDTRTGTVSLCSVKDNRVTCQSSADDRAALEAEISRLAAKISDLEKKLAAASRSPGQRLREVLPSDADMDKALNYAEKFMRRMLRIMREDAPKNDKI